MLEINLLPWRSTKRSRKFIQLIVQLLFAVLLASVILIAINHILSQQAQQESTKLSGSVAVLNNIQLSPQKQRDVINQLKVYQHHYHKVKAVIQQHQHIHELFEFLEQLVPEQIILSQITYHNQTLKLTGVSQSNSALSSFLSDLSKFSAFKSPKLNFSLHSSIENKGEAKNTISSSKQFELQVLFINPEQFNASKEKV